MSRFAYVSITRCCFLLLYLVAETFELALAVQTKERASSQIQVFLLSFNLCFEEKRWRLYSKSNNLQSGSRTPKQKVSTSLV
ncbi:unnamed protein product [Lathyrus sativus]|nr:unnamed protein product [Lathyrus sativus]